MNFTSHLLGAIDRMLEERFNDFETCFPATVHTIREDGCIDAMPCIRKMITNGVIENFGLPVLGVPLVKIGASGMVFDFELSVGDTVLLLFFSRDAGQWKDEKWGGTVDPESPFANDLNNCVAIPYCRADSDNKTVIKIDKEGVVDIRNGAVVIDKDGTVVINGNFEVAAGG